MMTAYGLRVRQRFDGIKAGVGGVSLGFDEIRERFERWNLEVSKKVSKFANRNGNEDVCLLPNS